MILDMIWKLIKIIVMVVATLVFGSVLYLQFSNANFSIRCVSGDYNYGCNVSDLNVVLVTIIGYVLCIIFIMRWKPK